MGLFKDFEKVSQEDWIDKINTDLKGKDYQETLVWESDEGIAVQPFYNDTNNLVNTPLKSNTGWKIRERVIIDDISTANKNALQALKGGANSILFIGEINSQVEMDALLKDIQVDIIELHFYNSNPKRTSEFISLNEGSISYDTFDKIDELADLTNSKNKFKTITVKSDITNSIIEELAESLSKGVTYLDLLSDNGIDAATIASKMQFSFGISSNYFFEIAKLRAARTLWNFILQQYKVENLEMIIHSETSIKENSTEDVNYEILRNTTKAMSAILGGCDSLTVLPHDVEKLSFSNRIARNVQHILKEEAFFDKVQNPADGSYYIEHLTEEIANKAW
ncbi:MAG: methylmalonyl-CoA mutase family protein, partial [Vicingaceae bacterium]